MGYIPTRPPCPPPQPTLNQRVPQKTPHGDGVAFPPVTRYWVLWAGLWSGIEVGLMCFVFPELIPMGTIMVMIVIMVQEARR